MASEHTAKAFDSDLQELTRLVAEMGGLAERMIADSVDSLVRRDVALSKRVVAADAEIDRLQHTIEERAVLTIARRQPMAVDLREIVSAMRVAIDLERIGDLAKNIGKRVTAVESEFQPLKLIRGLEHMTDLVQSQVKSVLDAYASHDLPAAMGVWKGDEEVDAICTSLVPRIADLHDGRPAQHLVLHSPDVLRQEHRADRRPRDQHRRDRVLHDRRSADAGQAPQGRHDDLCDDCAW